MANYWLEEDIVSFGRREVNDEPAHVLTMRSGDRYWFREGEGEYATESGRYFEDGEPHSWANCSSDREWLSAAIYMLERIYSRAARPRKTPEFYAQTIHELRLAKTGMK